MKEKKKYRLDNSIVYTMASVSSKLKAVLQDTKILASESELSYVNCLIPECKLNKTLLLHREVTEKINTILTLLCIEFWVL